MNIDEQVAQAKMVDIFDTNHVEVLIDQTNKLWINVRGKCLLRIGQVDKIEIDLPNMLVIRNNSGECSIQAKPDTST